MKTRSIAPSLVLAAVVSVSFACSETPTEPRAFDETVLQPTLDPGGGAMVVRVTDDTFLLPTGDPETGLVSVHYNSATFLGGFLSGPPFFLDCSDLVPFEDIVDLQIVQGPNGKVKRLFSGTVYVRVVELSGFPFNICDEPIAEGIVDIHGVDHLVAPGNFDGATGSYGSNGLITLNADGSDVRLHHTTKLDGTGGIPSPGTVRLR